jgi:hypothetical protein
MRAILAGTRRGFSGVRRVFRLLCIDPKLFFFFVRIAGWVVLLTFFLKIFSLPRTLRLISKSPRRHATNQFISPSNLGIFLDRLLSLNFFVFTPSCWKRAIILHRYLARQGLATRIVFGVQRDASQNLAGHAWLEFEGQPFLEAQAPDYYPTYSFPS